MRWATSGSLCETDALNDADGNDYDCCYYVRKLKRIHPYIFMRKQSLDCLISFQNRIHPMPQYEICHSLSVCANVCVFMNALCTEKDGSDIIVLQSANLVAFGMLIFAKLTQWSCAPVFPSETNRKCSLDFWLFTFDIITWLSLKQPKIIPKCRSCGIHYEFHLCKLNECHIHIINFTSIHIHFKNILM